MVRQGAIRFTIVASLSAMLLAPSVEATGGTPPVADRPRVDINRLAAAGIATGCSETVFCYWADISRQQMAAFLHRALA